MKRENRPLSTAELAGRGDADMRGQGEEQTVARDDSRKEIRDEVKVIPVESDLPVESDIVPVSSAQRSEPRGSITETRGSVTDTRPAAAHGESSSPAEAHARLFADAEAATLRGRWTDVQASFVDEPRKAVEQADSLVAETMKR